MTDSPQTTALVEETRLLLETAAFGRSLRGYASVTSTNTLAAAWADAGAPEGAVVCADHQQAGRGRLGRRWDAEPGLNLMFSVVLRPQAPPHRLGLLPLAAGLAVADAVAPVTAPLTPQIKWPNDVLLEDRKCCGMLLETAWSGSEAPDRPAVILGIGLNVNQDGFPGDLHDAATSLLLATGRPVPRASLFADLLLCLERRYLQATTAPAALCRIYEQRMYRRGQPVRLRVTTPTAARPVVEGIVRGITPDGALRLETGEGIRHFHAGEVSTDTASG